MRTANLLLSRLPREESRTLRSCLVPVRLGKGEVLNGPDHQASDLYFVESGVICLAAGPTRRESVTVALTGREGVAGALAVLGTPLMPHTLLVQIPGSALTIEAAFVRRGRVDIPQATALIEGYAHVLVAQIVQSALCNRYHTGRERLARWLLLLADRAGTRRLPLTHEELAQMIGGRRSLVTADLRDLRERQAIETRRGLIIVNRRRLAAHACDCYATLSRVVKQKRLFKAVSAS